MTTKYRLTLKSGNAKTGPIPVSTSSRNTCPDACAFKRNGCYADGGPIRMHWDKLSTGDGMTIAEFRREIYNLPKGQLWRHNQAGDLPGAGDTIDKHEFADIVASNIGKRGFTYTHKPMSDPENMRLVKTANELGFTVNLSGNSLEHADELSKYGLPVVTVLPSDHANLRFCTTPAGRKVVVCPATRSDVISCKTCALCQKVDRGFIIGFPAHGTANKKADAIARGVSHTTAQA